MPDPGPWALAAPAGDSVDLFVLSPRTEPAWEPWLAAQPRERRRWLRACRFEAAAGELSPEGLALTDTGLGPALAGFFTEDDNLAQTLSRVAAEIRDPVWRLPLWRGYAERIRSSMADLANRESEGTPIAAIAAALFLAPFAAGARRWIHFDFESWSAPATGLRPEGANVAGLGVTYALIPRLYA